MSESSSPETASSNITAEHSRYTNRKWYKLILGMPLLVITLYILLGCAMPGNAFFEGKAPGIYWLHLHAIEIGNTLPIAMFFACIVGLLYSGRRAVSNLPFDRVDRFMTIINAVVLALTMLSMVSTNDVFSHVVDLGSLRTEAHVYHLGGTMFISRYLVIECDRFDFMCQRIYESDKMGDMYQWNGSLEFDPAADEIRLIDSGNVLFTHKVKP